MKILFRRVLIVKEGYARTFRDNGKLKNFKKYEFGAIIGAASILSTTQKIIPQEKD